jgi:hypothetical protein
MDTTADGEFTGPGGYWLLDSETANMLGYYETEADALRIVAGIVREHGSWSAEACHLLLYQDGAEDHGLSGQALIARVQDAFAKPQHTIA